MTIDLRADLMAHDHTGHNWSLLEDAPDPSIIVPGALILAGEEGDPDDPVAVCRVLELEEVNGHTVVRFEVLPGHVEDYAILVKRHHLTDWLDEVTADQADSGLAAELSGMRHQDDQTDDRRLGFA